MRQLQGPDIMPTSDLAVNVGSFTRHLKAENLSPRTQETYTESVRQFAKFLVSRAMPQDLTNIHREHVESFMEDLLARWKPATANNRYRGLQAFWRWAADEVEVKESPMARMRPPRVPESPPDVLREDQLKALLATCDRGQELEERRDAAILRVFVDTGARLTEVTELRWMPEDDTQNDIVLDRGVLRVLGKGRRERVLAIGHKTIRALDRYLRRRALHREAGLPWLWLGRRGRMSDSGVRQVAHRRSRTPGGRRYDHAFSSR